MTNPAKFVREVRQETNKVVWPSRRETMVTTGTILIMVLVAALFFLAVDAVISTLVNWLLGIG